MGQQERDKKVIRGLSSEEVLASAKERGSNRIEQQKGKSLLGRIFENLSDPIIRVLTVALGLQILFSLGHVDWPETIGIVLAIIISTVVSAFSEYGSEKAFKRLQSEASGRTCRVMRDGALRCVPEDEIVCGDVVLLSAGEAIPADARMLDGKLTVNQSALNGENEEATKYPTGLAKEEKDLHDHGTVFRGTTVVSGEGRVLVFRVGEHTQYGRIAKELQHQTRESPLKHRLGTLARQISRIGYAAAALIAFVYLYRFFLIDSHFERAEILRRLTTPACLFPALLHAFTLAITMVVVAVPEGLPMMITVVLSSNMRRMLRDHVLVKKMVGIETAGSMNLLFCDKTGTLTTGNMTLDRVITADGTEIRSRFALKEHPRLRELLRLTAFYNTESTENDGDVIGGNATDRAVLRFFSQEKNAGPPAARVAEHIPFDSAHRCQAARLTAPEEITLLKGAPEFLLTRTTQQLNRDGTVTMLDERDNARLIEAWHKSASGGERVIAVCSSAGWHRDVRAVRDLTLIALMCLKDRVRKDAARSIEKLNRAGVQVVMMTGDNRETAAAIAAECGVCRPMSSHLIMTGAELSALGDGEVIDLLPRLRVVARALPSDKSRLVRLAQEAGMVVGMTGDGVNDAPSLKAADVGFAMGQGADIAKEAADIVLLDGRIGSIVSTVLYGRTVFHSIRKFITFQLMMNICAVGVSLIGQHVGIEHPITILQMLWVNMIMDTLGGLAFSGEAPLESYLREAPKKREESILTGGMIHQIAFGGAFTLLLCALFLSLGSIRTRFAFDSDPLPYLTAFFLLFIFCGIFNCFNVRTERLNLFANLLRNPLFYTIMLLIAGVQIAMVYLGGPVFRTTPLTPSSFLLVLCMAFTVIPFEFGRKIACKLHKKRSKANPLFRAAKTQSRLLRSARPRRDERTAVGARR